jgi:hypothetical protein
MHARVSPWRRKRVAVATDKERAAIIHPGAAADRTTTPPTRPYLGATPISSLHFGVRVASAPRGVAPLARPAHCVRSLAAGQQSWGLVFRRLVSLEVSYRLPHQQTRDGSWMGTVYMYLDRYTCTCTVYRARTVTCQERPKWKCRKTLDKYTVVT